MINKVTLIGNLGRDPEVRRLESGAVVANFPLATSENYKDKSGAWQSVTEWHDIAVWGQLAEAAERQLKKGMLVYVDGKIRTRNWKDADGNDRYRTEIIANTFRRLERREPGAEGHEQDQRFHGSTSSPAAVSDTGTTDINQDMDDDDLPF